MLAVTIPDFWAGVLVVLLVEAVLAVCFVVYAVRSTNGDDE